MKKGDDVGFLEIMTHVAFLDLSRSQGNHYRITEFKPALFEGDLYLYVNIRHARPDDQADSLAGRITLYPSETISISKQVYRLLENMHKRMDDWSFHGVQLSRTCDEKRGTS